MSRFSPSRRSVLAGLAASGTLPMLPGLALAAPATDKRFVLIILRGAMDGLGAVPAHGDAHYRDRRGSLAISEADGMIDLGGGFGLNPGLATLKPLWDGRELAIVHAVATPYRERSHFDAQNLLETGLGQLRGQADGWLNRTVAALPQPSGGQRLGLAVGPSIPLVMRGSQTVAAWEPEVMPGVDPAMGDLLRHIYANDKLFNAAYTEGVRSNAANGAILAADDDDVTLMSNDMGGGKKPQPLKKRGDFKSLASVAGRLLAAPDGARIAVLEIGGWDTHAGQGTKEGRLANALTELAGGITAMREAMGPAWSKTVVLAATEFGRTVAVNGTGGTDHGTATAAFLAGGAVNGGRVVAQWPGLAPDRLYQNRDLMPTTDLRSVLKGVLSAHLGLGQDKLNNAVFPDSGTAKPIDGLVRA